MNTEQAIEILENHLYAGKMPSKEHFEALAVAVQALKRQRWILVSDEIPQTNPTVFGVRYSNIVLVFTEDQKIMAAFLKKWPNGERHWYGPFEFWETDEIFVAHWMPLPKPPEEV